MTMAKRMKLKQSFDEPEIMIDFFLTIYPFIIHFSKVKKYRSNFKKNDKEISIGFLDS